MFSKEMEALISASIVDGVISDQEKRVLVKRAEKEGIDLDGLDVYIQSLLQKQKAKITAESEENKREKWHGKLIKCPACGAFVEPGIAKCTACGYAFSGIEANKSAEKLSEQLQIVEAKHKGVSEAEKDVKAEAMSTVIASFPIPNTKEDLMEFLLVLKTGFTKYTSYGSDYKIKQAYRAKMLECIDKIQISFPNDDLFQRQILNIQKTIEESDAADKKQTKYVLGCLIVGGILLFLFILLGLMGFYD